MHLACVYSVCMSATPSPSRLAFRHVASHSWDCSTATALPFLSTWRLQQLPQASAKDKTACCMHDCIWTGQNSSRTTKTKHGPHSVRSSAFSPKDMNLYGQLTIWNLCKIFWDRLSEATCFWTNRFRCSSLHVTCSWSTSWQWTIGIRYESIGPAQQQYSTALMCHIVRYEQAVWLTTKLALSMSKQNR